MTRLAYSIALLAAAAGCGGSAGPQDPHARCEAGDAPSCATLATAAFKGIGQGQDLDEAERLWGLACAGGVAPACMDAGILNGGHAHLDAGAHRHPNPGRAARWYSRACDLSEPAGCYALSLLHADGQGIERDPDKARRLMKRACDLGHGPACEHVGGGENPRLR